MRLDRDHVTPRYDMIGARYHTLVWGLIIVTQRREGEGTNRCPLLSASFTIELVSGFFFRLAIFWNNRRAGPNGNVLPVYDASIASAGHAIE